jgi:hypothetical protein
MDKYCSVARVLERTASITYSHELVVPAGGGAARSNEV